MSDAYQDITLVSGSTTITLPGGMQWIDRRSRNLVAQNVQVTLGGSSVIEEFQQQGGYPVTLQATGNNGIWVERSVVDACMALADAPLAAPMTLTFNDGTVISVRWSYVNGNAVDAAPVLVSFPEDSTRGFSLTLRMIQASA